MFRTHRSFVSNRLALRSSTYHPVRGHAKIQAIPRSERDGIACSTGYCSYDGCAHLDNGQMAYELYWNLQTLFIAAIAFWAIKRLKLHPAFVILAAFAYGGLVLRYTV